MADFHQAPQAGEGDAGAAGQDQLCGLARTGHGTGVGPLDRLPRQAAAGRFSLGATLGVEGDVDLALEAALAVPLRFAMAHQQKPGPGALRRQTLTQVSRAVQGFDLHLLFPGARPTDVEHRERGVIEPQVLKAAGRKP